MNLRICSPFRVIQNRIEDLSTFVTKEFCQLPDLITNKTMVTLKVTKNDRVCVKKTNLSISIYYYSLRHPEREFLKVL